ncbi:MAG TPA: winged helix-turn-helix domain-containing protein [Chloroflexota bacterium]|nr:winged helix-turn-helix domain-containing protein [Chloroflexota bacterium]
MRIENLSSRRPSLAVKIVAVPSCELSASLFIFLGDKFHPDLQLGKEWLDDIRAALSPDLHADLERFSQGLEKGWMFLWPWQGESTADGTCERFLARLAEADPVTLRLALLGELGRPEAIPEGNDLIVRAAGGDVAALETCLALRDACAEVSEADFRARLAVDLEEDKQRLVSLITGWYEQAFRRQEAELTAILERDAAAKRRLARRHTPVRQVELVTNGMQYVPEPGISRVLLLPSVVCRPWVLIGAYRETKIFTYSVAEESMSDAAPAASARLLALTKALADERRLQALQLLANHGATLQELADALGVGKSLMHHHMVILRAAGLVRVQMGGDRHYQLREETLASLPDLVRDFLARGARTASPPAARVG